MPIIPEVLEERKLWVIIGTRKHDSAENELEIIKPMIEKLNEQWFEKGDLIWSGRFDDNKTSMAIFEATKEKAYKYFDSFSKASANSLTTNLHQWDALPLLSIIQRIQGKI